MGLWVQLGHPIGVACINPRPNLKPFFILHSSGIHEVAVDFCNCDKKGYVGNWRIQCLCREWMPATCKNPEMCCTFHVMEQFHLQNLQAKISAYDYYTALAKLTDNTGTRLIPVSCFCDKFYAIVLSWTSNFRICTGYFFEVLGSGGTLRCWRGREECLIHVGWRVLYLVS